MEWLYQGIVVGVIVAGVREASRLCAYYTKRRAQVQHLRNEIRIYSDLLLGNRTEAIDRPHQPKQDYLQGVVFRFIRGRRHLLKV